MLVSDAIFYQDQIDRKRGGEPDTSASPIPSQKTPYLSPALANASRSRALLLSVSRVVPLLDATLTRVRESSRSSSTYAVTSGSTLEI